MCVRVCVCKAVKLKKGNYDEASVYLAPSKISKQ